MTQREQKLVVELGPVGGPMQARFYTPEVFFLPSLVITPGKRPLKIDLDADPQRRTRPVIPRQSGIRGSTPREDQHHRPVTIAEDPCERRFIGRTRQRTGSGMRMDPDPREFFGSVADRDLLLEIIRDGMVIEFDRDGTRDLRNQNEIVDA